MESQSPGATWGWACGLDPTRAVGERKESDKVRGERVRDTRGSAYANWLGGQGESGGAHGQGTQKGGRWLSGAGEDCQR